MKFRWRALGLFGLFLIGVLDLRGGSVSFDRFVSAEENDLVNEFHTEGNHIALPDGGITGGSVSAGDGTGRSTYRVALSNGEGSALSTSLFFRYASSLEPQLPGVPAGDGITTRLGFVANREQGVIFFEPDYGLFAELSFGNGGSKRFFGIHTEQPDSGMTTLASTVLSDPLVDGNWYRINLNLRNLQWGEYALSATLEDYGATGKTPSRALSALNAQAFGSLENNLLFGGQDLYAGWAGYWHVSHFDEFSAASVPEPGALGLLTLGGLLVLVERRRSTRRGRPSSGGLPD